MLKSDRWIRKMALENKMIKPFFDSQIRSIEKQQVISYGLSSYGYDISLDVHFKLFTNVNNAVVDPKNFQEDAYVDFEGDECYIPANSFALAVSKEYICLPRNILALCIGKSTYARCGIIVNITPFEPEWEGYVTIEISNTTPLPAKVYANEGIAQVLFFEAQEVCEVSYADRVGKYMNQKGITVPIM